VKIAAKYVHKEAMKPVLTPKVVVNMCATKLNIFKNLFLAVQFERKG